MAAGGARNPRGAGAEVLLGGSRRRPSAVCSRAPPRCCYLFNQRGATKLSRRGRDGGAGAAARAVKGLGPDVAAAAAPGG